MIGSTGQITTPAALRVLLIEDSLDDADLVLAELRSSGYTLEHARVDDPVGLRAALASTPWQIVLADYSMPAFDALAALAIVKECRPELPFIIISGVMAEETAVAAMRAGADDFLTKGKLARLVPAIERELRDSTMRAERAALQRQLLLSDRLVQIGTLAAGVAHEINNPLAYVIGNVSFALEQLTREPRAASDTLALVQALRHALEGAERIRAIAGDLRVFSRTDDNGPQPVELRRVLESSISMAWNQIRHRARLTRDFQDVPPITGKENRLGQVFLNLLINAAHAIPEGDPNRHEVHVRLCAIGAEVRIEVSDSGQGIAPEVREHLFQPFFTTKPREIGTGLGLSICQQIVRDAGGEITVHPRPSGGTMFRVRLPAETPPPPTQPPQLSGHPATRRGRVLVIDDEPAIVNLIERLLSREHDTVGIVGARAALRCLQVDHGFDVVFCDLMMPDMSGVEFYEELEQTAPQLVERVVFLTGGAFTPAARQFLARVANAHLHKPFDAKVLRATVADLLNRPGDLAPRRSEA